MKKYFSLFLYTILFIFIFMADRVTKSFVLYKNFYNHKITSFLTFDIAFNRGISWGMFDSKSFLIFFIVSSLVLVVTICLAVFAYFRFKNNHRIIGEVMAVAGSFSNIVDRILYEGVVDFVSFHYKKWSWPVFNVADVFIVMGIILIFLNILKND